MTDDDDTIEAAAYARVAGFSYLATMLLGLFSVNLVASMLVVPGDNSATISNIQAHEKLFRVGVASEVVMYALVILLAFSLYVVLKPVNRNLALLALLWRLAEAIVGSTLTVASGILPLLLLESNVATGITQLHALVAALLGVRGAGLDVVLLLIGLGGTIFCYLFWISRYIPRLLALWGIFTYLTMLLLSLVSLLTPVDESTKMLFYAPGGLFELILGGWLLLKGVDVKAAAGQPKQGAVRN